MFITLLSLLAVMVVIYCGLHWALPTADPGEFFWVNTLPGRLAEWSFWYLIGVGVSLLSFLALSATGRKTGAWAGHTDWALALKRGFLVGVALLALLLGSAVLEGLAHARPWLSVDVEGFSAGIMIPSAFVLGLYSHVGLAWISQAADRQLGDVVRLVRDAAQRAVMAGAPEVINGLE